MLTDTGNTKVTQDEVVTEPSEVTLDLGLQLLDNFVAIMEYWTVPNDKGALSQEKVKLFPNLRPDVKDRMMTDPAFAGKVRELILTFVHLHRPFAALLKEVGMPL
jgi:hypothetical protein